MQTSSVGIYHIVLRVSALTLALLLLFDSGLLSPVTKELANQGQSYVASVISVGAAVAPTEINTLTAQISLRENELDAREAVIAEREIAVGLTSGEATGSSDLSTYVLSIILFILVVLIVLNYVLDFIRERETATLRHSHEQAT